MKIVNIAGGLGNQMFQYAFALGLQVHFKNEPVKIDISTFKGLKIAREYELEDVFDIKLPVATPNELRKVTHFSQNTHIRLFLRKLFGPKKTEYKEPRLFTFWGDAVFNIQGDCYYNGSWQNERYFQSCSGLIREAFRFKNPLDDRNMNLKKRIESSESVSIHVRRGDYLNYPVYQGVCDLPYYTNAISYILGHVKEPHFFIFSTDTEWCEENIVPLLSGKQYTIVDWNKGKDSYKDMELMSCCKNNIIAHSSFSWWAAWLNNNDNKIVVAPKEWYRREDITDKPQLDSWIKLENK